MRGDLARRLLQLDGISGDSQRQSATEELRLKNGRSRVAPTPLRSLPRVGISDSFLTDWPDGTGLWHLYRTPIRGATVGSPVATSRCRRPCGSSRCDWSLNAAGCSDVAEVMDDQAE